MLFSSAAFLFGFLPLTFLAFHGLRMFVGGSAALTGLALASLVFYAWWNPPYVALLLGSVTVNFFFARLLTQGAGRWVLPVAISLNLAAIGYFKYRNFFLDNVATLIGESWTLEPVFVPLAISFFTFQQIALLCDVSEGQAKVRGPRDFLAFVVLFPQLIAGPIVLFREMAEQFEALKSGTMEAFKWVGPGLVIFALGLFKKVVLADTIGPYADTAFAQVSSLTLLEAWGAALAYSLQLFFDFSGYSDMAVGLGMLFGFRFPINFNRPFRAVSMIDFWKRWHITMTRFFMMYLYSPIALSIGRKVMEKRLSGVPEFLVAVAVPITITFLLSGLWHGAAWTFVAFGAVNAFGLIVNHAWKKAKLPRLPKPLGWTLTMLTVVVSFVYFRAESLVDAHQILWLMVSPSEFILPNWLSGVATAIGLEWRTLTFFATGSYTVKLAFWILSLGILSMLLPNLAADPDKLRPNWRLALGTAGMLWLSFALLDRPQAFIYFQF